MNNAILSVLSLVAMYCHSLKSSLYFCWRFLTQGQKHALIRMIRYIWTTAGFYFESTEMKKLYIVPEVIYTPLSFPVPLSTCTLMPPLSFVCVSFLHACSFSLLYL